MQYDHTSANQETIESTADARPTTRSQLEQSITKGARVRQPKTRAVLGEQLDQTSVVGKYINGPRLNFGEHALMEVLNFKRHP